MRWDARSGIDHLAGQVDPMVDQEGNRNSDDGNDDAFLRDGYILVLPEWITGIGDSSGAAWSDCGIKIRVLGDRLGGIWRCLSLVKTITRFQVYIRSNRGM